MAEQVKKSNEQFSQSSVPAGERKSCWEIGAVCMGYVFIVTSMQVGSVMGASSDFKTLLLAVLVGSLFLLVLGSFMALIAIKTGMTFGLLTRFAYGNLGSKLVGSLIAVTLIAWFSVDSYLVGQATNALFPNIPIIPVTIIAGIGMTVTALYGMKYMSKLGSISVPLILIFGAISMFIALRNFGGISPLFAATPATQLSFFALVSLTVGSWVGSSITLLPDIIRFARTKKQALVITLLATMVGNPLMILVGAIGTITTGQGELSFILAAQGLLAPAFIIMVLNNWSAAQGCAYSGALTMGSVTKVSHKVCTICFGIVGIILAVIGFYNYFGAFINFLASTVPAVGGVFIADYLVTYRKGYGDLDQPRLNGFDWLGIVSLAAGVAAAYLPIGGIDAVTSLLVAGIARALLSQFVAPKMAKYKI